MVSLSLVTFSCLYLALHDPIIVILLSFLCILCSSFLIPRVDNESELADSKDRGFDNGKYCPLNSFVFVYILFCTCVCVLWSGTDVKNDVLTSQGDRHKS